MAGEPSVERRRRSRSRSPTKDRYGRRAHNRESKDTREYGKDTTHDTSRERRDKSKRRREGDYDNDHDDQRHKERERERSRDGSQMPEVRSGGVHGDLRGSSESYSQWSGARTALSDNKKQSRWGTAVHDEYATNGAYAASGDRGERSNGGMYGPADRGGGGGGRGRSDESWLEYRLKLRADAKPPRGMWNSSPSPPRRKVAKIPQMSKDVVKKKDLQRRSSKRHGRSRVLPSRLDSSSSSSGSNSSSNSSSDSSSSGDSNINGEDDSDGNSDTDGDSYSDTDTDKRSAKNKSSGKRKPSSSPPSVKNTVRITPLGPNGYDQLKLKRSVRGQLIILIDSIR